MLKKYEILYERLRKEIVEGTYKPGEKLPTENAMETWGYSRNTVRQALALLQKDNLIIKRHGSGSTVRPLVSFKNRSGNVAVIFSSFEAYTFPQNINGINDGLKGWATPLLYSNFTVEDESSVLDELLEKDIDGVIVNGLNTALPNPNVPKYQALIDKGVPVIFLHAVYNSLSGMNSVTNDDIGGGQLAVQHLYEHGRRNICGIFVVDALQFHKRYEGYCIQLEKYGMPVKSENVLWLQSFDMMDVEKWTTPFLQMIDGCDGLICTTDIHTIDIYNILNKAGKMIPEDIAVISFDNSYFSEYAPIPITSMDFSPYDIGFTAAQILKDKLAGKVVEDAVIPWRMVQRQST